MLLSLSSGETVEIEDVPYYPREHEGWEIITASRMLLKHYGTEREVWDIAASLDIDRSPSLDELVSRVTSYLATTNYNVVSRKFALDTSFEVFNEYVDSTISNGSPVIVAFEKYSGISDVSLHAVLFVGIWADGVYLHDPGGEFAEEIGAITNMPYLPLTWEQIKTVFNRWTTRSQEVRDRASVLSFDGPTALTTESRKGTLHLSEDTRFVDAINGSLLNLIFDGAMSSGYRFGYSGIFREDTDYEFKVRSGMYLNPEIIVSNPTGAEITYTLTSKVVDDLGDTVSDTERNKQITVPAKTCRKTVTLSSPVTLISTNFPTGKYTFVVELRLGITTLDTVSLSFNLGNEYDESHANCSPVTLSEPVNVNHNSFTINWSESTDQEFREYRVYLVDGDSLFVSPENGRLLETISSATTTSLEITTGLEPDSYYVGIVCVVDTAGYIRSSNLKLIHTIASPEGDEPPDSVTLSEPSNIGTDGLTLTWTRSYASDFYSYSVFMSTSSGVDSDDTLLTTITNITTLYYDVTSLDPDTTYYFRVYVNDNEGYSTGSNEVSGATQADTWTPPVTPLAVTTESLPEGSTFESYSTTLQATGGTVPYIWEVVNGELPSGLNLSSSTGVLSGTPIQAGEYTFIIQVSDSSEETLSDTTELTITTVANKGKITGTLGVGYSTTSTQKALKKNKGKRICSRKLSDTGYSKMNFVPGEIIVGIEKSYNYDEAISQLEQTFSIHGLKIQDTLKQVYAVSFTSDISNGLASGKLSESVAEIATLDLINNIKRSQLVRYAQPNYTYSYSSGRLDPDYGKQWHLKDLNLPDVWKITPGSEEVIVAVIDSGVDYNHPDLANNILHDGMYDFISENRQPLDQEPHGTHVAGIIGAIGNNGEGGSGVAPKIKILPLRVRTVSSCTTRAITYAAGESDFQAGQLTRAVDVINLSLGGFSEEDIVTREAIQTAINKGIVVVCASGNEAIIDGNAIEKYVIINRAFACTEVNP